MGPGGPVERILQDAGHAVIIFRGDDDHAVARLNGRAQGAYRFMCVLGIIILVVERQSMQRKNLERGPRRERIPEAAKHRGAVGAAAQASGETEKAKLDHRSGTGWPGFRLASKP